MTADGERRALICCVVGVGMSLSVLIGAWPPDCSTARKTSCL